MKKLVTFHISVFTKKRILTISAMLFLLSAQSSFALKSILRPAAPAAYTGPNQTICNGSTVSIGGAAVVGSTYSWSPITGLSSATASNPNASPNTTITYTLTETNGGVSSSNTVTITVNPIPGDNTGADQVICKGSTVPIGGASSPGSSYSWSPATGLSSATVSNPTAAPSASTTYTLTETFTSTGCFTSNTIQIIVNPLPVANAGSNQTICSGSNTTIGSPAVAGNTYTWSPSTGLSSPSSSQPVASPIVTTTYTLTETITATDCQKSNTVVVTVNPAPAANTGPNQTICSGLGAGSGVTIGAAAVAGDTYSWSPSSGLSSATVSNPTASPAATTTYTLTETNTATSCTKTGTVMVSVNPAPAAGTGPDQTICSGSSVVIGAAPVSGNTYSWAPATGLSSSTASNPTANPTATTTYTLTETVGSTGCSRSNVITVTVNPSPAADTGPNKGICLGGSTIIGAAPIAGNTYSWSPLLGLSSTTSSQPTASPLVTTTYTLTETVISTGCKQMATVTVTVSPPPTPLAGPNQTICEGSSATLGTIVSVPGHTYTWSPVTGLSSPNTSQTLASPSVTTTYTLTESSAPGCSKSDTVVVTVNPAPAANPGANQTICDGTATTIGAPPVSGDTYSWSPATGLSSTSSSQPTAAPITTTTYTLTETITATNCSKSNTVTITVKPSPAANTGPAQTICPGGSIALGAAAVAGDTYTWSPATGLNRTDTSWVIASPASTTTYTLTESNAASTCSRSSTVEVTVNPTPSANTGPAQTICNGSSVTIGAAAVPGNTYSWSPSTGLSSSTVSNPTASPAATTTYTLTESAGASCQKTNTVVITVKPAPIADAGPSQTICAGSTVSIGTAAVAGNTYTWSPGAGLSSASSAQTNASPTSTTTYTLTVTGANGCNKTDTARVTVNPTPAANAGINKTLCAGDSVRIGSNATPGHTYSWSPAAGLSQTSSSNPMASPAATTTYTLTETNAGTGCNKSNTVTITVAPKPNATVGASPTICKGTGAMIGAAPVSGDTYTWTPASGLSSSSVSNPIANPSATTTYTLTETNAGGCSKTNTVTVTVNTNPLPVAYTGPDQTINKGSGVNIGGPAVTGDTYSWSPATGLSSASVSNPNAHPDATTTYTLTETNSSGCSASNMVVITVIESEFYNGFSPNGDGKNDGWNIPMLDAYPSNSVLIINRWGSEVWKGDNYDSKNTIWTGQNMNGQDLPDGTYYYIISYNNQEKRGWVVLKR